jgi:xanthine dehydrogenase small subunit
MLLGQIDGAEVTTVEGLAGANGELNPTQRAMVDADASQCGFCTPGFVIAIEALRRGGEAIDDDVIHDALAGNLCRCTGYRPIVDAARAACGVAPEPVPRTNLPPPAGRIEAVGQIYLAPSSLAELIALRGEYPAAKLFAGGTDLGLLASKERQRFAVTISTRGVGELRRMNETPDTLRLGAAVTYSEASPRIDALYPSFGTLIRRIGSRQIRNLGTIGGNIANASPIGDTPPCLIALGATLVIAGPAGERSLPLEEFFLAYRKTALAADEVIAAVILPKPADGEVFRAYKLSKRYDQDISSVIGAYRLTLADGVVRDARIAYGGMAATPKRAIACEAMLTGKPWTEETAHIAAAEVGIDFAPIDDHRASAGYRLKAAGNLFVRLWRETAGAAAEPHQVFAL